MNETFINELAVALAKIGTIHNVGEEWISYVGEIPPGGLPYCGQTFKRSEYAALWSWVQSSMRTNSLVISQSEWDAMNVANNGNVPYYGNGDGSTTFTMPKIVGYIKGAPSQPESGRYYKEGLPNITGNFSNNGNTSKADSAIANGSFAFSGNYTYSSEGGANVGRMVTFDASRSNAVYGNSDHVTPETSTVMFGVYAYGALTNVESIDLAALATSITALESNAIKVKRY